MTEKKRYDIDGIEQELKRRKKRIPGAIAAEVADVITQIRQLSDGEEFVIRATNGNPYMYLTAQEDGTVTEVTVWADLQNHVRGQCLGVGEVELGHGFGAGGGNTGASEAGVPRDRIYGGALHIRIRLNQ